jgi:uncharacterized protein
MDGLFAGTQGERLGKAVLVAVILLAVFLGLKSFSELQSMRYIGAGVTPSNTISVSGYGESFATPDIATFSFTVSSKKSTVAAAQTEATNKINAVTKYLKDAGIEDRDIQTSDYSVNPQYDYIQGACANGVCPPGRQVLNGYEVRQTTTIKVRDAAKAGDLLTGVGNQGATEVSGLNFTFDDPNKSQNDARSMAIADAKKKADELAKELGVRIVRVVSFSENGGGYPMPYAYGRGATVSNQAMDAKAIAPEISIGQNKVQTNVSVTYEIR